MLKGLAIILTSQIIFKDICNSFVDISNSFEDISN